MCDSDDPLAIKVEDIIPPKQLTTHLSPRGMGEFAELGYYLPSDLSDWIIVEDALHQVVLLRLRKGAL